MNHHYLAVALFATLQLVSAQEKLSHEEALGYADAVRPYARQTGVTPIATDVDFQKPAGVKEEQYGGMVLPQKNLKVQTIAQAGTTPIPVGQLWLHKLTPVLDGAAIPAGQLRLVTVQHNGEETTVPACALGVRQGDSGALELLVFGKDKEPLLKLPLKKIEAQQELPLEITAERTGDEGLVTLKLLGAYEAKLKVTELQL